MKVYKLEVMVIDFDNCGGEDIKDMIQDARYPNRAIGPQVKNIESVDIGEWSDDHPLNNRATCEGEYKRIFAQGDIKSLPIETQQPYDGPCNAVISNGFSNGESPRD